MDEPLDHFPFDPPESAPVFPGSQLLLRKVVLINFVITLAYMVPISLSIKAVGGANAELNIWGANILLLIMQVGLNLVAGSVMGFSKRYEPIGSALVISSLITAAVGFGTCIAIIWMMGL